VSILLGCIADDFTGATDLANNLVRNGMRVVQTIGVPRRNLDQDVDAVVVALKSRNLEPEEAVTQSLEALNWLRAQGAKQIYFKYCSTFDSTPKGNIGPVTEALMEALDTDFTIATPAFPDNGRSVFMGYLFVGDVLLSESGMRNHPLTPMTDPNLVRVLQAQCKKKVGLISYQSVLAGVQAVTDRIAELRSQNISIAIVDAVSNEDLYRIAPAFKSLPLLTAGSGVAIGLPGNFGLITRTEASVLPPASGYQAIISGSCSEATNRQVTHFKQQGGAAYAINPLDLLSKSASQIQSNVLAWAQPLLPNGSVLIYSTANPDEVRTLQEKLGTQEAGCSIENMLASIADGLVSSGVRQLLVAGGETSGACVRKLGVDQMQIGPQIDPGVPWCYAQGKHQALHLALKSGNFGADNFFTKAFSKL
jgi:uncharacterized protein YgbK (DUF1537 family)